MKDGGKGTGRRMVKRNTHPALALKTLEKQNNEQLQAIVLSEACQSLTSDQRHFLINYCYHKDWKKAQLMSTVTSEWLLEQESDPQFMAVVKEVLDQPELFAEQMARDASPLAMLSLIEIMQQDKSLNAKFLAAKEILEMAGIAHPEETNNNTQFNVSIQMFDKSQPIEGKIIDHA